jgi:phage terminase small subunit
MAENLTYRQRKAVEALLSTTDTTQAALAAGVSRETVYRWMRDPAFRDALKAGAAEALEALSRSLVRLSDKAIKTLEDALTYDLKAPGARVRAADVILGRLLQLKELVDLEGRVSDLERMARNDQT